MSVVTYRFWIIFLGCWFSLVKIIILLILCWCFIGWNVFRLLILGILDLLLSFVRLFHFVLMCLVILLNCLFTVRIVRFYLKVGLSCCCNFVHLSPACWMNSIYICHFISTSFIFYDWESTLILTIFIWSLTINLFYSKLSHIYIFLLLNSFVLLDFLSFKCRFQVWLQWY